jgi:hypothetical protein
MFTYRITQSDDGLRLKLIFAETFVIEMLAGDAYAMAKRIDDATRQMAYIPCMEKGTPAAAAEPIGGRFQIAVGNGEIL